MEPLTGQRTVWLFFLSPLSVPDSSQYFIDMDFGPAKSNLKIWFFREMVNIIGVYCEDCVIFGI